MEDLLPEETERWRKADTNDDNVLTLDEFLSFQHPEHNEMSIKAMAGELMDQMDDNHDMVKTKSKQAITHILQISKCKQTVYKVYLPDWTYPLT